MKKSEQTPIKERRKFDKAFKREAVNNWVASGKSAAVVAGELGIDAHHLYGWKADLAPADLSTASLEIRLAATQRELARVSEQRDLLKKRWAFSPNQHRTLRPDPRHERRTCHRGAVCRHLAVSPSGYYAWQQRRALHPPRPAGRGRSNCWAAGSPPSLPAAGRPMAVRGFSSMELEVNQPGHRHSA